VTSNESKIKTRHSLLVSRHSFIFNPK